MNRPLTQMTLPELDAEHKKMCDTIERLRETSDETGLFQLRAARAIKFGIECMTTKRREAAVPQQEPGTMPLNAFTECGLDIDIGTLLSVPIPIGGNVLSLCEYRIKRAARDHSHSK